MKKLLYLTVNTGLMLCYMYCFTVGLSIDLDWLTASLHYSKAFCELQHRYCIMMVHDSSFIKALNAWLNQMQLLDSFTVQ